MIENQFSENSTWSLVGKLLPCPLNLAPQRRKDLYRWRLVYILYDHFWKLFCNLLVGKPAGMLHFRSGWWMWLCLQVAQAESFVQASRRQMQSWRQPMSITDGKQISSNIKRWLTANSPKERSEPLSLFRKYIVNSALQR